VRSRFALERGAFVGAACVACCAPPIIVTLGVTAGLAATAGIFLGIAAVVAVILAGGAWLATRRRRRAAPCDASPAPGPVPVAGPTRR
jgi:mercuric ion transport protein